jgi:hypothetical protein
VDGGKGAATGPILACSLDAVRLLPSLIAGVIALLAAAPVAEAKRYVPRDFFGTMWDRQVEHAPPEVQEAQFARMARSGVETVRVTFKWADMQPVEALPPDFSYTDRLVEYATRHGIRLLPTVIYAPEWARFQHQGSASPPRDPAQYAEFLKKLVARYGPSGSFWTTRPDLPRVPLREYQIWNEVHLAFQWAARPHEWAEPYGELLRASYTALKQADPGSTVVLAGLTNDSWNILRRLYEEGGIKGYYDVAGIHPYTVAPDRVMRAIRYFRRVMRQNGDGKLGLWVTELGFPASKGRSSSRNSLQTTERGAAERLTGSFRQLVRTRRDRKTYGVDRVYYYTWASEYRGDEIFSYTGLLRFDGSTFVAKRTHKAYVKLARKYEGCAKAETGNCL